MDAQHHQMLYFQMQVMCIDVVHSNASHTAEKPL